MKKIDKKTTVFLGLILTVGLLLASNIAEKPSQNIEIQSNVDQNSVLACDEEKSDELSQLMDQPGEDNCLFVGCSAFF